MPLGKPALAALAIFTFQGAWNDLLHPLVYMPSVPNTMLTVGLAFFQQQMTHGGKFTVLMAGALSASCRYCSSSSSLRSNSSRELL